MNTQIQQIPITAIDVGTNVRTSMDKAKLEELRITIAATGKILQPVKVRPVKLAGVTVAGKYQLVYGGRRVAAGELAGLTEVPAIVEELSDSEVRIEQLIENDPREDLSALDRAKAYAELREFGLDNAAIAKRVGRARSTVEVTVRLNDLVPAARKALLDGWLPQGAAEELALLSQSVQGEGLKLLEQLEQDGELTRERAKELLRRELLLDLAEVKFDPRDPNLVPAAGACIPNCTKRTGAQAELFGGGKGPDCCTDKACLRVKEGAWLKLQEKAGRRVLSGPEVKETFNEYGTIKHGSTYAKADEKDYYTGNGQQTYRQRLGKSKEAESKVVLARAPSGELIELVDRKDLPKEKGPTAKHERSAAEKRAAEVAKVRRLVTERALVAIATAADEKDLSARDADQLIVEELLEYVGNDRRKLLASFLEDSEGLKVGDGWDAATKALRKRLEACKGDAHKLVGFAFQLIGASALGTYGSLDVLKPMCKLLDVDLVEIQKAVELERREKQKAKAGAKATKKVAKKKAAGK